MESLVVNLSSLLSPVNQLCPKAVHPVACRKAWFSEPWVTCLIKSVIWSHSAPDFLVTKKTMCNHAVYLASTRDYRCGTPPTTGCWGSVMLIISLQGSALCHELSVPALAKEKVSCGDIRWPSLLKIWGRRWQLHCHSCLAVCPAYHLRFIWMDPGPIHVSTSPGSWHTFK